MSEIKVNKISPRTNCGTVTLGDSGEASWRARTADDWNLRSFLKSLAISLTSLWNGSFLMRSSVDFWNFLMSLRATVPGLNLCGLLTPPGTVGDFPLLAVDFAAAMFFLGCLEPVAFLAVCLVRAIVFCMSF